MKWLKFYCCFATFLLFFIPRHAKLSLEVSRFQLLLSF